MYDKINVFKINSTSKDFQLRSDNRELNYILKLEIIFYFRPVSAQIMSNLCEYDRIRLDIIAERQEEWDKLVKYKMEFDTGNKEQKPKSVRKLSLSDSTTLRRSSRKKPKVNYKEDSIAGQAIKAGFS